VQLLLDETKLMLSEAIEEVKPGATLGDIGFKIESRAKKNRFGIVTQYGGHGIGTKMHEDPHVANVGIKGTGPVLKPGMVICIEPMISLGTGKVKVRGDGWGVVTIDKSVTAHFEHMVAVTTEGHRVLSDGSVGTNQ
jgi:methionyl aminopeptidase